MWCVEDESDIQTFCLKEKNKLKKKYIYTETQSQRHLNFERTTNGQYGANRHHYACTNYQYFAFVRGIGGHIFLSVS